MVGINGILQAFNLDPDRFEIQRIPSGHIHATYKLIGQPSYILQRVNKDVFKKPDFIAANLRLAANYLRAKHPDYLFLSALPAMNGAEMSIDDEGYPWRLFRYIDNSITIDKVETEKEAFIAAAAFGRLTRYLDGINVSEFRPTIDRFHDLGWRYEQFEEAAARPKEDRLQKASPVVEAARHFKYLVDEYKELINSGALPLCITHNDTKINNILLDATSRDGVCVIDLDTLMPGYFIYDVGDMIRTFVSPVDEEEKDLTKVIFRKNIYESLVKGYLSQMGDQLSVRQKTLFPFAGMMMTYIMALRMLSDYLNGDIYYHITYPEQNFVRASNQFRLLEIISTSL